MNPVADPPVEEVDVAEVSTWCVTNHSIRSCPYANRFMSGRGVVKMDRGKIVMDTVPRMYTSGYHRGR